MSRFLLDTNVLVWFITENKKLDRNFAENIEYFNGQYAISVMSIVEIINLIKIGHLRLGITIKQLLRKLESCNIKIIGLFENELLAIEKLPLLTIEKARHSDYGDRTIIATAIANKLTLAHTDRKFHHYSRYGLNYLNVAS